MILTCPECATRYFVDDARIGPEGRKVRCAGCGHAWREAGSGVNAYAAPLTLQPSFAPAAAAPAFGSAAEPPVRLRVRGDVSSRLREEAVEKRKTREAVAVGAVWAVLGAGFCVLALCSVIFRADVVRLFPGAAGAYAFVRMPVNPTGLAIEGVQGGPGLQDGRAALKVSGVERNVETGARDAAPLRVSLLDKGGRKLASTVVEPPSGAIQPGETRAFTAAFIDPPLEAASFQVEFAFDAMKAKAKMRPRPAAEPRLVHAANPSPAPAPSAVLKLRGTTEAPAPTAPAAKEAAPLPATSPYALPPAARPSHG